MGSNVFANGMEIASVASDGKSIAAMPDVCYTPPQAPPTPTGVPVPYPNTGMASDLTGGSTSVMIGGNPACLKDKSSFKKTSGDEAGSAPLKGLVSMSNAGAVFFAAWSMDVKIEGENVVRNLDIGTHNHASDPGNAPPWPFAASASAPPGQPPVKCGMEGEKRDSACSGKKTKEERCDAPACRAAMKCQLQPHRKAKEKGCCKGQTPHHLVEVHGFTEAGGREAGQRLAPFPNYDDEAAPCACCERSTRWTGEHGDFHAIQGMAERACMDKAGPRSQMGGQDGQWTYKKSKEAGIAAHHEVFKSAGCSAGCIAAQLDDYHNKIGANDDTPLRADWAPLKPHQETFGDALWKKLAAATQPE